MNAFCIHLPHRTDRMDHMKRMQEMYPFLTIHFVEGVRHENGAIGCLRSHKKILQMAKEQQLPYILVLEDDCEFLLSPTYLKNTVLEILEYMKFHPEIQVINGCGNLVEFKIDRIDKFKHTFFLRSPDVRTTHCIFYNSSSYDTVLECPESLAIDEFLNKCTMVYSYPYIAQQLESFSDINKQVVRYTNIDKSIDFVKKNIHQPINFPFIR